MKLFKGLFIVFLYLTAFKASSAPFSYVGAEFQNNFHRHDGQISVIPNLNVFAGAPINDHVGYEFGSYYSAAHEATDYTIRKMAIHGSLVTTVPVFYDKIGLKFGLGGAYYMPRVKNTTKCGCTLSTQEFSKFIPRISGALEIGLKDQLKARVGIIWENASKLRHDHKAFDKDDLHFAFGLAYTM